MHEVIEQLRAALPPIFLGSASDGLTGGAIHWETIQNKRAMRKIPDECFLRSGPRILILRDHFLDWWSSTLQPARQSAERYAPQPNADQRKRAAAG